MNQENKFDSLEAEQKFKQDCEMIFWITGKKWHVVQNTFTLPELLRLQAAIMFFDFI
jgi:hypothetical protein